METLAKKGLREFRVALLFLLVATTGSFGQDARK